MSIIYLNRIVMDSKPVEPLKDEKPEKKLEPPPTKKSDAACLDIIVNV
jgi:hypothetical protein